MHIEFDNWLAAKLAENQEILFFFTDSLKNNPNTVKQFVEENIEKWHSAYTQETGIHVEKNCINYVNNIVRMLRKALLAA
ncbi:MAG: hypothetical protein WCK10_00490 [Candidatus Staskawiczbacteria bacterium]